MGLEDRTQIRKQALSQLESMEKDAFFMNAFMRNNPGPWWSQMRNQRRARRRPRRRPPRRNRQGPIQPTRGEARRLRQFDRQQALQGDITPIEYMQRNRALNDIAGTYQVGQTSFGQPTPDKARQKIQQFDLQQARQGDIDPVEYMQRNESMGDMFNDPFRPGNFQFGEDLSGQNNNENGYTLT